MSCVLKFLSALIGMGLRACRQGTGARTAQSQMAGEGNWFSLLSFA